MTKNLQFKKVISLFLNTGDTREGSHTKMYRSMGYPSGRTRKFKSSLSGFTLVELLVVIGIITLLMVAIFPNFTGARQRARDSQRKTDLKNIQTALDLYKLDQKPPVYPLPTLIVSLCGKCWSSDANCGVSGGNIYIKKLPCDPGGTTPTPYVYVQNASDNLRYTLTACLENPVDPNKDQISLGGCPVSYTVSEP